MKLDILTAGNKRQQMEDALKEDIRTGRLKPGETLPTYDRLADRFNASRATFCYVVNTLKEDGYIVTVKRQGTFVAERPPCFHRFALVYPYPGKNIYWTKMLSEFTNYCKKTGNESVAFYGSGGYADAKRDDWKQLYSELSCGRLAAVFFVSGFNEEQYRGIVSAFPNIPMISFHQKSFESPNVGHLWFHSGNRIRKVAEQLADQNVTKAALIGCGNPLDPAIFVDECKKNGIETRDEWMMYASESYPNAVPNIIKLLLSLPKAMRPDGLYITDDNLIEKVQSAIFESGVSVPGELKLVTHYNFPGYTETALPMRKVGPDLRSIIKQFMTLVENIRSGHGERELRIENITDSEYINEEK